MLNRILRASKLYGRHLSLEPDLKPESSFSAGNFLATFNLELARDYSFEPEILKPDIESFKALWETAFP